jgi:hypothetical protein
VGGILYGIYWIGFLGNTLEGFLGWDPIWNIGLDFLIIPRRFSWVGSYMEYIGLNFLIIPRRFSWVGSYMEYWIGFLDNTLEGFLRWLVGGVILYGIISILI